MFRSELMTLCQMFVQPEAAYTTVAALGEVGCVQFVDLQIDVNSFQKQFVGDVRRCDEIERKIHYIDSELRKDDIILKPLVEDIPAAPSPKELADLEGHLERVESELLELSHNEVGLKSNLQELTELRKVLEDTEGFFSDHEKQNFDAHQLPAGADRGQLGFVAGVINRERIFAFERMLWRISRGNIYLKSNDSMEAFKDPITGYPVYKSVFVVFFQGEQLRTRVKKVCAGFRATLYPCPSSHEERVGMSVGVRTRIEDLKLVISQSEDHRHRVLAAVLKELPTWTVVVKKAKAIYHTLNMFSVDASKKCMIGECWIPDLDIPVVRDLLIEGSAVTGSVVPSFLNTVTTHEKPPTYYRTNKFTSGFQTLIDAYGVASYREVNPALYTCITFPFLFSVMFGDLGHGFLLFLFGLWMVLGEKKLKNKRGGEIWKIFFGGRYIIMLMGIFACYTGLLYNDIFSKSLNIFGSAWRVHYNTSTVITNPTGLTLNPTTDAVSVYPFGLDPVWQLADNKIIFSNTYKMKLSIIIGVLHMIFGVCMSVENYVFFKRYYKIFLEFLPQIIFLLLLFGYMVFMMFFKWVKYSATSDNLADTPGCAPSVLIMFINMMLFKSNPATPGCEPFMFDIQPTLQKIFVPVAVLCIPWLLVGTPTYIQCTRKNKAKEIAAYGNGTEHGHDSEEEEEEPMSEIWIHQAIHTIEYILSTISHTASYLRLWALSLAHAQLSEVLWTMVMTIGLSFSSYTGCIALYFIFGAWALLTIGIMIMMEGLSAFLHTLRLHWVEFMSKFYEGAGIVFQPFSFKVILDDEEED